MSNVTSSLSKLIASWRTNQYLSFQETVKQNILERSSIVELRNYHRDGNWEPERSV